MIAGTNDIESERPESAKDSVEGRINRKLGHGEMGKCSGGNGRFGHKCLQYWVIFGGSERRCTEGLDVEGDCGTNVRKRFFVSVALADDRAARKTKRIRDVAIGMPLNDDFEWCCHGRMMDCARVLGKRAEAPNDPDQRPRAPGVRFESVRLSRGSMHPVCSAITTTTAFNINAVGLIRGAIGTLTPRRFAPASGIIS